MIKHRICIRLSADLIWNLEHNHKLKHHLCLMMLWIFVFTIIEFGLYWISYGESNNLGNQPLSYIGLIHKYLQSSSSLSTSPIVNFELINTIILGVLLLIAISMSLMYVIYLVICPFWKRYQINVRDVLVQKELKQTKEN